MSLNYFIILDIIGIVAFSVSGFIVAVKKDLDMLGGFLICVITALGGGILRDVLANNTPFAFYNLYPLLTVFFIFLISIFSKSLHKMGKNRKRLYTISDSIGLVFFAIAGGIIGIESDFHIIGVCLMSLITAAGGGVLRDMALGEIPSLFKEDFYGMVAIIIGLLMFLENTYYKIDNIVIIANMIIGLSIRYFVTTQKISMPSL